MKHPETQARDALLHSDYGKFDLVVNVIPKELLYTGKPRRIKEWLVKNLNVSDSAINANTLRSWLYRYRKSLKETSDIFEESKWQSFEPSIAKSEVSTEKLVIKKVSKH